MQYGEIEEMNVCDNLGDHLVGNVYVKVSFYKELLLLMTNAKQSVRFVLKFVIIADEILEDRYIYYVWSATDVHAYLKLIYTPYWEQKMIQRRSGLIFLQENDIRCLV